MLGRLAALASLAACGRLGFGADARSDTTAADAAPDAGLPAGLVAWYPLDDQSFRDSVSSQTGTCFGTCPVVGPGHIGQGLVFDGASDCVGFPDDGRFDLAQLTVAVWANQSAAAGVNGDTQVAKRVDVTGNVRDSWQLEDYSDGTQAFTSNSGTTSNDQLDSAAGLVTLGVWHHLAISFDGTTRKLYVDGALRVEAGGTASFAYDSHAVTLGCDDNAGVSEAYAGTLDELEIYNRALTDAEIAALAAR